MTDQLESMLRQQLAEAAPIIARLVELETLKPPRPVLIAPKEELRERLQGTFDPITEKIAVVTIHPINDEGRWHMEARDKTGRLMMYYTGPVDFVLNGTRSELNKQ